MIPEVSGNNTPIYISDGYRRGMWSLMNEADRGGKLVLEVEVPDRIMDKVEKRFKSCDKSCCNKEDIVADYVAVEFLL